MNKMILIGTLVLITLLTSGCNVISRTYGGDSTIYLEPNKKLMNASWKGDSLWILTRDMKEGDIPEKYSYKEDSNFGILEGTITIIEEKR